MSMKKILMAATLVAMAGSTMAADPEPFEAGTATALSPVSKTYEYQVAEEREDRFFVKNAFRFTLSANVVMNAVEDEANNGWFAVGTYNSQGRNIFTSHSDGGSVTSCGDALTQEQVKAGDLATELEARFDVDGVEPNACLP